MATPENIIVALVELERKGWDLRINDLLSYAFGKPPPGKGVDGRKSNLPYSSIRVYRALKKMFSLDAERRWQNHPELIDDNCWRETSRAEIARMAKVGLRSVDNQLSKLKKAGIVDTREERNDQGQIRPWWVRFRADRVIELARELASAKQQKPNAEFTDDQQDTARIPVAINRNREKPATTPIPGGLSDKSPVAIDRKDSSCTLSPCSLAVDAESSVDPDVEDPGRKKHFPPASQAEGDIFSKKTSAGIATQSFPGSVQPVQAEKALLPGDSTPGHQEQPITESRTEPDEPTPGVSATTRATLDDETKKVLAILIGTDDDPGPFPEARNAGPTLLRRLRRLVHHPIYDLRLTLERARRFSTLMEWASEDFTWMERDTSFEDFIRYWPVYAKKLTQDEADKLVDDAYMAFYIVQSIAPIYLEPSNSVFPYYGRPRDEDYWLRLFFVGRQQKWPATMMDVIIPRARQYLSESPLLYSSLSNLMEGKLQQMVRMEAPDHHRLIAIARKQLRAARIARAICRLYGAGEDLFGSP